MSGAGITAESSPGITGARLGIDSVWVSSSFLASRASGLLAGAGAGFAAGAAAGCDAPCAGAAAGVGGEACDACGCPADA